MIGVYSDNSDFYLDLQVDPVDVHEYNAYTGGACAVSLVRQDDMKLSLYRFVFYGKVGGVTTTLYTSDTFHSDAKGTLEMALRDWIATQSARTDDGDLRLFVYLTETNGTAVDQVDFTLHVFPGVSGSDVQMPISKDSDIGAAVRNFVMPPNVIISPPLNGVPIVIECDAKNYESTTAFTNTYTGGAITPSGPRGNQIPVMRSTMVTPAGPRGLKIEQLTVTKTYVFEEPPACSDLVLVAWTSLTGAYRKHVFPVVSFAREWESQGIARAGNGIPSEKNTVLAVRCRLTGLTAYGYWYYMDLLSANDVHAVQLSQYLNAVTVNTEILSPFSLSTVEGGTSETPAGNGFYNFEFTIKMRRYDTF